MQRLVIGLMFLLIACGGSGEDAADGAADGGGLVIDRVSFDSSEVTIRNSGSEPYDLTGHAICNRPGYFTIPGQILEPGESVVVDASGIGISAGGGEVGLYSSSNFGDAGAILAYVQWGSDSHGRTEVAVQAGVWAAGEFVEGGGSAIVSSGNSPNSASDWSSE